jgi:hypothetical protein
MQGHFPWQAAVLALLAGGLAATAPAGAGSAEEFLGPFPSWRNVRTDYGAVGDGAADDTAALQRALDELRFHREFCVLYLPAGTYRITDTLRTERRSHHECLGVTVVGEDPATTSLRWAGPPGGLMFKYDAWYAKIARLTFDGGGTAGVALAYGDAFSTYNETSDMVFRDVGVGLQMATGAAGQAENAVLRCLFLRCTEAGIRTSNYNSLDIWAWNCRFEECGYGLYNGAGNFHAYRCLFLRSAKMDIGSANLMSFAFVNNTSVGSRCFLDWDGGHTWGAQTSITGNRIRDTAGPWALKLGNGGPYLVMDNVIEARPEAKGPVVRMTWGDQAFIGNRYSVRDAVETRGRFLRIAEREAEGERLPFVEPAPVRTPPRRGRPVLDLPAGADAGAIQAALDEAAARTGQRPVVHLPMGRYTIARTLTVAPGSDVQIVGDGGSENSTVLLWAGPAGQPLLHLAAPACAVVRDLHIQAGNGIGVRVDAPDTPALRHFLDQVNVTGIAGGAGLLVDGIEQGDVQARCLQGGHGLAHWVRVLGGPERQAGRSAPGQVSVFCGATGTAQLQYAVENGGRLLVRSVYHEASGDAPTAVHLTDAGSLTIDSTRFSYRTSREAPLFLLDGFRGDFALTTPLLLCVGTPAPGRFLLRGDGRAMNALCLGAMAWASEPGIDADVIWRNETRPPARGGLLLSNLNSGTKGAAVTKDQDGKVTSDGFGRLEPRGNADDALILRLLQPLREARMWEPGDDPGAGVALHRVLVSVGQTGTGVLLRGAADAAAAGAPPAERP